MRARAFVILNEIPPSRENDMTNCPRVLVALAFLVTAMLGELPASAQRTSPATPPVSPQTVLADGKPRLLYTDLVAGPIKGGENDLGAYISFFGFNFGTDARQARVFFGDREAAAYRYFGPSRGRPDVWQITVQPGAIGTGTLPVRVEVNGVASNTDHTFMVNPGDILFVDNVDGNDLFASANKIAKPWRHLQTPSRGGALAAARPGDVIVLRGKSVWRDIGYDNRWARLRDSTGSQPTGKKGTGYIAIVAYPGEDVHYVPPPRTAGGIQGVGDGFEQYADWLVISGLHIESDAHSLSDGAPVNLQVASDHWRVVNNEIGPWPAGPDAKDKAGGVVGNGEFLSVLGNHIHDIGGGTENHGIYLDSGTHDVEIAWNHIHHVTEGNLVQTFDNLGDHVLHDIDIHHNLIHDGGRYGLNIADGTEVVHAWNNLIYDTAYAGLRINVATSEDALMVFEHNTLYNVCMHPRREPGAIENTWTVKLGSIVIRNNIVAASGACEAGYDNDGTDTAIRLSGNLFHGFKLPERDPLARSADPLFVDAARRDLRLTHGSPAIDASVGSNIKDDYRGNTRTRADTGAYEF